MNWIIVLAILVLAPLVFLFVINPLLGFLLPRRITGTAYLIKQLRRHGVDPQQIGLPALHEIVDDANKLSRYQAILKDKLRSEWFIANLESAAFEIASLLRGNRTLKDERFVDKILIKHGVISP